MSASITISSLGAMDAEHTARCGLTTCGLGGFQGTQGRGAQVSLQKDQILPKVSLTKGHLVDQGKGHPLHPVLLEKLNTALAPASPLPLTTPC
jgi:hypothetical protein